PFHALFASASCPRGRERSGGGHRFNLSHPCRQPTEKYTVFRPPATSCPRLPRRVLSGFLRQRKVRKRCRSYIPAIARTQGHSRRQAMFTRREALLGVAGAAAAVAALPGMQVVAHADEIANLPREKVTLVAPPFVHAHEQVATGGPKVVEFAMTIEEKPMVIDNDGTELRAMTYNGTIPGPMMVVHEGDYVELTLINPDTNEMPHNVDFHAATGALGGGALTFIMPGEQVKLRFKATRS